MLDKIYYTYYDIHIFELLPEIWEYAFMLNVVCVFIIKGAILRFLKIILDLLCTKFTFSIHFISTKVYKI
jgi:hypothetical protein